MTTSDRFLSKVSKSDGCHIWIGAKTSAGYGLLKIPNTRKNILAHRFAYQQSYGEVPKGLFVCHRCDNPSCVNPAHLFVGSASDNMADMIAKGRNVNVSLGGEMNGMAKITNDQRIQIQTSSGSLREIASKFGIGKSQVHRLRKRISNDSLRSLSV